MTYDSPFVLKVRLHIAENLHKHNYQIEDVCHTMGISRAQLYRKLKKLTGKTFTQMVHEIRIRKACLLLQNADLTIGDVADTLGFSDASYFTKVFRNVMGMTPGKWRMKIEYTMVDNISR